MHAMYALAAGPLAWAAFILFFGGLLWRLIQMLVRVNRTEKFIYSYFSLKYGLRSIGHWLIPFGTASWRRNPVLTVVTFIFHLGLLITPLFLLAHLVLWEEAWGFRWGSLPDLPADILTIVVIAGCLFFLGRRLTRPEVKFVTYASDYILLLIVAAPFVTGFLAYHQWGDNGWLTVIHMLSGEVMLAAIPFTRLIHMLFAIFTRAYMGSEFGKVRHARDW